MNQTIQSLNQTIEDLRTEIPKKPQIITVTGEGLHTLEVIRTWTDLLTIPNVTVSEGANVVAIATAYFLLAGEHADYALGLVHTMNTTYGEARYEGFRNSATHIVEMHHTWLNLTAGTYTFAIQYCIVEKMYVANSKLTLMIF